MKIIAPRKAFDQWDNFDNPTNFNHLWSTLKLKEEPRLGVNEKSEIQNRKSFHIGLYVTSYTPETGVLLRPTLYKYSFAELGWGSDGYEDYTDFAESDENRDILVKFMIGLGLKFASFPSSEQSVALAEKLYELSHEFRQVFDEYFIFDEIADNHHQLALQLLEVKENLRRLTSELTQKDEEINRQKSVITESRQIIQRILINAHINECLDLIVRAKSIDSDVDDTRKRYEALITLEKMQGETRQLKREVAIAGNLHDGARLKARNFHDKELKRIFGSDSVYIEYPYLKSLLSKS